jgi:NAD(P)H-quinone oxidoreductase subunit 4
MLQMISHGLIAAALFFLAGVAYDRTHTLMMDKMGGLAKSMPTVFALFTVASMASLALPGMSGFVSELAVFLGFVDSDAYTSTFKLVVVLLSAIGLILTPIYLLSMLREIFYGKQSMELGATCGWDAKPRELFVAACLLLPIIAVGVYPKLLTQIYDATTVQIATQAQAEVATIAHQPLQLYQVASSQKLLQPLSGELLGVVK